VTDQDVRILAFCSVHRVVVHDQVKALLRDDGHEAGERLDALTAAGLLRRERASPALPDFFRITRAGLASLGSNVAPPAFSERWRHDVGIGWLWLMAGRERFGALERVFTAAEMRAHDDHRPAVAPTTAGANTSDIPPFGIVVDSHGGDPGLHYPDLLFVAGWGHCAVYLQLVPVATRRLAAILTAYARHKDVRVVLYLQAEPVIGRAIERTAEGLDLSDLVRVHSVRPPHIAPSSSLP